ncbi:aldehyde dehydrogenase [Campylobacter fetus]|uniref:Aldehyde dehydrogenase n=5 Tax=Campylobacter fetus TaxID=196 RepID=A0A5L8LE91_CAMFE|nr:aldehyde dehydrogenase [Campylobacter fetus]OCS22495.1 aldehyde dehydrogenase [Campylobacter fetus subsp. venerealis cfvi97/532]OCS26493.1 aldehyde dehydrogenase [Campylobacter fetus subsp. venerealis cfvB10]OCS29890.1 aldehyde dehydrogenase [Campylobacter fetus subsp. venerealis LMG 6570 = CCUG 33900]OCS43223.1 aldehyde dehydrogenase [Campylobacter fetus subsp. venerealis cfvi02/298]ABK82509.1 aldehyde dehydrogenase A [Campylobacter fetus subsp. fetus 82-40]
MRTYEMYIDGAFVPNRSSKSIEVLNPATKKVISTIPDADISQVEEAISSSKKAQKSWEALAAIERANYLRKIANEIRENSEMLAQTITEEQGKIISLARVEVNFTADYLDYMAEWARRYEGEIIQSDRTNENIFIFKQAIGVTSGILPWNFPFFLIARKLAPALVTGNTIVIKASVETPNNAFEFAKLAHKAGLPKGVFNLVSGRGSTVGNLLASHKDIGLVSFTGSVETGAKIMEAASKNIIKVNLELGGKAPAIVCRDADIDAAVNYIKNSRIINTGQVCNCAERVYVQKDIIKTFTDKMVEAMKHVKYGIPTDEKVDMGPLVSEAGLNSVNAMVERAKNSGAKVLTGGRISSNQDGYYYEPTVITDIDQKSELIQSEIFGPVLPIVAFDSIDNAIEMANDSDYGLTSSIYTQNIDIAMRACREIKFGETYINRENFEAMQGFHAGFRKSGIGGADGKHGLEEYLATHVVYLQYNKDANF